MKHLIAFPFQNRRLGHYTTTNAALTKDFFQDLRCSHACSNTSVVEADSPANGHEEIITSNY